MASTMTMAMSQRQLCGVIFWHQLRLAHGDTRSGLLLGIVILHSTHSAKEALPLFGKPLLPCILPCRHGLVCDRHRRFGMCGRSLCSRLSRGLCCWLGNGLGSNLFVVDDRLRFGASALVHDGCSVAAFALPQSVACRLVATAVLGRADSQGLGAAALVRGRVVDTATSTAYLSRIIATNDLTPAAHPLQFTIGVVHHSTIAAHLQRVRRKCKLSLWAPISKEVMLVRLVGPPRRGPCSLAGLAEGIYCELWNVFKFTWPVECFFNQCQWRPKSLKFCCNESRGL